MNNTIGTVTELRAKLAEHNVTVDFTKTDGSNRLLLGTTQPEYLKTVESLSDEQLENRAQTAIEADKGDLVTAWDIENGGWRSFHFSQINSVNVQA